MEDKQAMIDEDFLCTDPRGHVQIVFQHGTVKDVGVNGAQVEDVIDLLVQRLQNLNKKIACRENSIAITKLEEATLWLLERTRRRMAHNVEGTMREHAQA